MRFLTKDWYELMQRYGRPFDVKEAERLRKQLDIVSSDLQKAMDQESLPEELRKKFFFHDGEICNIQEGADYILEISSPFSEYRRVMFCGAMVKQDRIPAGAVWLYEELYRHFLGYEAHILCWSSQGLRDTKIICTNILFEK